MSKPSNASGAHVGKGQLKRHDFQSRPDHQLLYKGNGESVVMRRTDSAENTVSLPKGRKTKPPGKYQEDAWSGSRINTQRDKDATAKLLEILKGYQEAHGELFASKRMRKKEYWLEITDKLIEAGFLYSHREKVWEKVSQKFRNLERTYRIQIDAIRKNKDVSSRNMEFFEELHDLLSFKYNTQGLENHRTSSTIVTLDNSQENDDDISESTSFMNGGIVTAEMGPELHYYSDEEESRYEQQGYEYEHEEGHDPAQEQDVFVETPLSPTSVDDKSLVFGASFDPNTAAIRSPVLRLLLEMRAQERAHHRQERRERAKLQQETLEFRQNLVTMLDRQHQERMDAMYALIGAISGVLQNGTSSSQEPESGPNGRKRAREESISPDN